MLYVPKSVAKAYLPRMVRKNPFNLPVNSLECLPQLRIFLLGVVS